MLSRIVTILMMFSPLAMLHAQQNPADSLESLVKSVPSDTTKVWLLNELVQSLREKNNNRAMEFATEARHLAELLSYKKGLAVALENLGWLLYRKGDYTKSFDISAQGLELSEELGDKATMARCLITLAAINYEQKQYEQALANFRSSYRISEEINDRKTMARCLNNIAYAFVQMNNTDSALYYVKSGLNVSQGVNENYLIAYSRRTLGDIYLVRKEYPRALENFQSCYDISLAEKNMFLQVSTLHRLGKLHHLIGQYDKALDYYFKNIGLARSHDYKEELERTYKLTSETYHAKNDVARAFEFQSRYIAIHDSLSDQRQSEHITLIQARFNAEIKDVQIELLTKEAALKEEEINAQKVWLYFYVGCLSLSIILAFVLFYNVRYATKAKRELEEKNAAINVQAIQLKNVNATKDKLFSIISHDLRSPLASLRALMELVGTPGLKQDEFVHFTRVLKRNLDSVHEDLDNLLLWAQTQLNGLQAVPEKLNLKVIAAEKISLLTELANAKNISIVNNIDDNAMVVADRNHVGLILRNLIGNSIKFNEVGGSIVLANKTHGDYQEISVTDSGVGIDAEDIGKLFNAETHFTRPGTSQERGVGIGLLLTKEFVENNKGSIWVGSERGKGTTFTFTLKATEREIFA